MARIPEVEVGRLKREVSLLRVLEDQGQKLVRQGKDWACRCPWHEGDATPSCMVSTASNLWHCFGCGTGGSVIDWTMRWHRVSFRHAVELLRKDLLASPAVVVAAEDAIAPLPITLVRNAVTMFARDAGEQALFDEVVESTATCWRRRWRAATTPPSASSYPATGRRRTRSLPTPARGRWTCFRHAVEPDSVRSTHD